MPIETTLKQELRNEYLNHGKASTIMIRLNTDQVETLEKVKESLSIRTASATFIRAIEIIEGPYNDLKRELKETRIELQRLQTWHRQLNSAMVEKKRAEGQVDALLQMLTKPVNTNNFNAPEYPETEHPGMEDIDDDF